VEGRPLAEQELVLRAQRGDARAYEELVRSYRDIAFRVAYVVAGDAADAEDATQDAFFKAWRALPRFRVEAPLRPWLLRIVANEARNRRRAGRRRAQLALRAQTAQGSGDAAPSPDKSAAEREERERLLSSLDALPDDARLVLVARYLLGLSEHETAAALGIRHGTVKSRTARALDRLRETYGTR
jgi:RNA polymerase sigma factor (sigma-70 family)